MSPKLHPDFVRIPLAHRALHDVRNGRPENSCAAIKAAITAGYGIEIDVQESADCQAMVFHDYDLTRLSKGTGRIAEHDARALAATPLRGGNEGIPTLSQILALVAGKVPVLIEVKDQDGAMGPNVGALEEAVCQELENYSGPVAVMSFNRYSVRRMAQHAPDIARGLVTSAFEPAVEKLPADVCAQLREINDFDDIGCSFISHERSDLARLRVRQLKSQGARILCWTVRSKEQEAQARTIAENITFERYLPAVPA